MTRACQTTPDGNTIYPGLPGETVQEFIARSVAEWEAGWDGKSADSAPPSSRFGFYEYGRG